MNIKGNEVEVKVTAKTLVLYKQTFKKDLFKTLNNFSENPDYTDLFEIAYILTKQNSNVNCSYADYLDTFVSDLNLGDVMNEETLTEITNAITTSMETTKTVKKKVEDE